MHILKVAYDPNIQPETKAIIIEIVEPTAGGFDSGATYQYSLEDTLALINDEKYRQRFSDLFNKCDKAKLKQDIEYLNKLLTLQAIDYLEF